MAITHFPIQTLPATATNVASDPAAPVTATNVQVAINQLAANSREKLTANRTYFVRTDGSDSNTGLNNSAGGAFLTIGKAVTTITTTLDNGAGWAITVQVGSGTYTEDFSLCDVPVSSDGGISILPASTATIDGKIHVLCGSPFIWNISGFTHQNSSAAHCFDVEGFVTIGTSTWGTVTGGQSHIYVHNNGQAWQNGSDTISGGAGSHWKSESGGIIRHRASTITLSGTPGFSVAFAVSQYAGDMQIDGNTYVGSATGKRFIIQFGGGRISTGDTNFDALPGNAAPTFTSGFYEDIVAGLYPVSAPPRTITAATDTTTPNDYSLIANRAGTVTLTLPSASLYNGRRLLVKTIQAQTVVSNSSNVVPLVGGGAGTAILANVAGRWANLQSDGTNWIIMAAN